MKKIYWDKPQIGKDLEQAYNQFILDVPQLRTIKDEDELYNKLNSLSLRLDDLAQTLRTGAEIAEAEAKQEGKTAKEPEPLDSADESITVTEAATLLGVSPGTVSRWATEDRIKDNEKVGRDRRLLKSTVLLMKAKREKENHQMDAKETLRDRQKNEEEILKNITSKIPDKH